MKRLLAGIAAIALLATPAFAQTTATSRADVVLLCSDAPAQCATILAQYLATLPPAAQRAAYEAIVAQLAEAGVDATLPPPPAPATLDAPPPSSASSTSDSSPQPASPR